MVGSLSPRVGAVIVTHDRLRTQKLSLNAVLHQALPPGRILVVASASSDGPRADPEGLAVPNLKTRLLPENGGPAGGFADGFEQALRGPYRHARAMADDAMPGPDCLGRLLAATRDGGVGIPDAVSGSGQRLVNLAWAGVLVSMMIVRAVGIPDPMYFWRQEDSESLGERIRRRGGHRLVRVDDAEVLHLSVRGWRGDAWQYDDNACNELHFARRVQRQAGAAPGGRPVRPPARTAARPDPRGRTRQDREDPQRPARCAACAAGAHGQGRSAGRRGAAVGRRASARCDAPPHA